MFRCSRWEELRRDDDGKVMWQGWKDVKRGKWMVNRGTEEKPEMEDLLETFLLGIDPFGIEGNDDEDNEEEGIDLPSHDDVWWRI